MPNIGFQFNTFQSDTFATDAYVRPKPRFTAKQPQSATFTLVGRTAEDKTETCNAI